MEEVLMPKYKEKIYTQTEVEDLLIKSIYELNGMIAISDNNIKLSATRHLDDNGIIIRCMHDNKSQCKEFLI